MKRNDQLASDYPNRPPNRLLRNLLPSKKVRTSAI
jgi:hypothetical protein